MKITREKLKQIIKEELESFTEIEKPLAVTPDAKMTGSQQTRKMRADASTATSDSVTTTERAVIEKVRDILTDYAKEHNLASGNVFTLLNRVTDMMQDKIKKPQAPAPEQ